jgi:hypothetical protein
MKTLIFTRKHNKPRLHIHAGERDAARNLEKFLEDSTIETLNVAGSRASKEPNIYQFCYRNTRSSFQAISNRHLVLDKTTLLVDLRSYLLRT